MSTLGSILCVEDEQDIQTITKMALETVGNFSVEICSSGHAALDFLNQSDSTPDLILLDVMMPGMDGPQTFQALRKIPHCKKIPVVFMTAKVQADEIKHYLELGAADVISKPFDPMKLPETVQNILNSQHGK